MSSESRPPLAVWVHRLSIATAVATFCLLVIGGMVNATGSSLACPEPTFVCHGQLFPPMTGGVFYEHGHRLAAMTVGLLTTVLMVLLILRRRWFLGPLLFVMVCAQGTLGAITVKYKLPWYVSTTHLLLAMSFFATLIYTAFSTRPPVTVRELEGDARLRHQLAPVRKWIFAAVGAVFVQLLLGALVRHLGAAMVCLGMPSCTIGGDWWPEADVQKLHMVHRGFGCLVAVLTSVAAVKVFRAAKGWPALRALAAVAPALVVVQIGLGVATVLSMRAVPIAVLHFAGAESLWTVWMSSLLLVSLPRRLAETTPATELMAASGAKAVPA